MNPAWCRRQRRGLERRGPWRQPPPLPQKFAAGHAAAGRRDGRALPTPVSTSGPACRRRRRASPASLLAQYNVAVLPGSYWRARAQVTTRRRFSSAWPWWRRPTSASRPPTASFLPFHLPRPPKVCPMSELQTHHRTAAWDRPRAELSNLIDRAGSRSSPSRDRRTRRQPPARGRAPDVRRMDTSPVDQEGGAAVVPPERQPWDAGGDLASSTRCRFASATPPVPAACVPPAVARAAASSPRTWC